MARTKKEPTLEDKVKAGYIDLTETGPLSYRELQGLNSGLPKESTVNSMIPDNLGALAAFQRAGKVNFTPEPTGLGESIYDPGVATQEQIENLQDYRAEAQPWYAQIGAGLAKGVVLAGTTFLDGTIGLLVGGAEALSRGGISGLWDNDFSRAMQAVNEWSEEAMPNYYSYDEQNSPWYENIFTANFIGDKFIKNLGFSVGALYSGGVTSAGLKLTKLPQLIGAITKSSKAPAAVSTLVGATTSAVNEGRIEALNNSKDWQNLKIQELDDAWREQLNSKYTPQIEDIKAEYQAALDEYEATKGKLQRVGTGDSMGFVDPAAQKYQARVALLDKRREAIQSMMDAEWENRNSDETYRQVMGKIEEDRLKMGNTDMLLNLPILTASNIVQFTKFYSNGFNTARRAGVRTVEDAASGAARYAGESFSKGKAAWRVTKGALSEGTEEISQKAASLVAGDYYSTDVNNFYKSQIDKDAEQETLSWVKSFASGINETVNDASSWEEFFIGALTGVLGVPSFRSVRGADGSLRLPVELQGGAINEIREYNQQIARSEEVANYLNQRVQSPEFLNYYRGLIRHNKYQNDMNRAVEEDDEFNFKNAEHAQFVSDIVMFDNAGKLEDLRTYIDSAFDLSDENLQSIVENTTTTYENGKKVGPFVDSNGNPMYATEEGKQQMVDKLTQSRNSMLETLDNYRRTKNNIDVRTGGNLSDEQLTEMAWLKTQVDDWSKRANDMTPLVKRTLTDLSNNLENTLVRSLGDVSMEEATTAQESMEGISRIANQLGIGTERIEQLRELSRLDNKRLTAILTSPKNEKFVERLIEDVSTFGSDIISALDKQNVVRLLRDLPRIGKGMETFNKKLEEYLADPEKQLADHASATEAVRENIQQEKRQTVREALSNAKSLSEFREALAQETEPDVKEGVLRDLDSEGNQIAKNYRETEQYNRELKKAFNELGETDQVSQDAMALWQEQFSASENLEQLANPNSIYINNEDAFLEDSEGDIDMAGYRFQNARYALQRAMSKVNNDIRFKNRFSEEYRKPIDEPVSDKGTDKDETGDSKTPTVPPVNPGATPVETPSAPVGNLTAEMVAAENRDANRRVETQRSLDQSQQGQRKYYRPAVPELHIEASKEGDFRPFDVVVAEREPNVDFSGIYNYLRDNGAFSYVNAAKLKVGDTLGFMIDPDFNDHTIFLVDTRNNQIVGSIDESDFSVARYEGLTEVINKVRDEYQASKSSTVTINKPSFTTDYQYDNTIGQVYGIDNHLDRVENGVAIYVDNSGNPTILLAAKSDHQFVGIFKDSNSDRWSIKMENKEGAKEDFKGIIAATMAQLPIGAEIYERTSISLDGLRVFAQQLNHGFVIGNDTYETDVNGGDLANKFGLSKEAQDDMANIQVTPEELPRVKEILRPYLEKFGVSNIDNAVYITGRDTLSIKLPVLIKTSSSKTKSIQPTGKFFATPQTRVSKMMIGRIPYSTEDRSLADIPGVLDGDTKPVFGIIKNGTLTTNEKIDDRLIVKPVDMAQKEGRLYLLIPNAAGTYSPAAVRVKHFNNQEFNLDDATVANTPIGRGINEALDKLANATSQDDVSVAMKELAQDIYMQDVMVTWFDAKAGSGIVISRKVRKPNGAYEMVNINGQEQIKENKYTIYYQSSKRTIDINGLEYTYEAAKESGVDMSLFGQPRETSEIRRDILNTILGFNLPIQVSASRINDSGYNNRVIKSNVLTSNLREAKVIGSWFTTDYFDKQGNLQRSVSPSSVKPAPSRRTTTPVGGTEGVIQGTPVRVGNSTYTVDLKTMVYTDSKGAKYAATTSNANIFDMAWAQENFGDSTESSVMTENKIITPQGRVLDRNTGTYVSDAEAKRIKDKITGRNQATQNRIAESKRVIADIYENQKKVDKTRTDSNFYYVLEDDGQYHEYSRVHSRLGDNWLGERAETENSRRALEAGTAVDKVIRDFFTSEKIPAKPDILLESAFIDLIAKLADIKSKMEQLGETFMANNIVLFYKYADGTRIAGEVDILSVDRNGNFKIYDVKTSKYSFNDKYFIEKSPKQKMSIKDYYVLQLSAYQNLFESQYNIRPTRLAIFPFVLKYDKNKVSSIIGEKGIIVNYSSAVNVPLASAVQAPQQQESLPVFDASLETMKPENRVLPENAFEEGGEVGFYEKDSKLYTGYLKKAGEVEVTTGSGQKIMMPIHVTKVRDKGFGREREFGSTSEYIVVFPNGYALTVVKRSTSDNEAFKLIMDALTAKPEKVLSLSLEKTQMHNPRMLEEMEAESKSEQYSPGTTQPSKAATTIQKEDSINNHDEEFEDELDLGELRRVDDASRETWNQEKELAWIKRVLPQLSEQDRVRVTKGLIQVAENGPVAWGRYSDGIIELSDVAAKGTAYHEAFHLVSDLMLTPQEKEELLNEARQVFGNKPIYELEEDMAEGFREYMASQEDRGLGRKIIDFFKNLFAKVTNWKYVKPSLTSYYRMISQGGYSGRVLPESTSQSTRYRVIDDVDQEFERAKARVKELNNRRFNTEAEARKAFEDSGINKDFLYRITRSGAKNAIGHKIQLLTREQFNNYKEVIKGKRDRKSTENLYFDRLDSDIQMSLLNKGWTQEKFDSISQPERDQAVECAGL